MQRNTLFKIVLFFCFLAAFYSCAGAGKEKILVGKWRLVFNEKACLANMQNTYKKSFEKQPKAQQQAIIKDIAIQIEQNSWVEFKPDNTFEQVFLEGETKHIGKWQIKAGGSQLVLKWLKNKEDKTPKHETCDILQLDAAKLRMSTKGKMPTEFVYTRSKNEPEKKKANKNIQKAQLNP